MDVKALIVGIDVLKAMSGSPHMIMGNYEEGATIQRIGCYGMIPVYLDEGLEPDKILVSYTLVSGEEEPDEARVKAWRSEIPEKEGGGEWIMLAEKAKRPPGI